jgi:hypothetical protein
MKIALALIALSGVAHADGAYVVYDGGGAAMRGDLDGLGPALHGRIGLGVALGDWGLEGWYGGDASIPSIYSNDTSCNAPPGSFCPDGGGFSSADRMTMTVTGLDLRRAFTFVEGHPSNHNLAWLRPRVQAFLHGGVRKATGDGVMTGRSGTGVGVGAGVDLVLSVFTTYVEAGVDRYDFGDGMSNAQAFHVVLGERIGFGM